MVSEGIEKLIELERRLAQGEILPRYEEVLASINRRPNPKTILQIIAEKNIHRVAATINDLNRIVKANKYDNKVYLLVQGFIFDLSAMEIINLYGHRNKNRPISLPIEIYYRFPGIDKYMTKSHNAINWARRLNSRAPCFRKYLLTAVTYQDEPLFRRVMVINDDYKSKIQQINTITVKQL